MCVIEVTLVLCKRCPALPAGGNAAKTGQDTEGCGRKEGPGGQCPSIDGREEGRVPASQHPRRGHLCSRVFTSTESRLDSGGSDLVLGAGLQTGKPPLALMGKHAAAPPTRAAAARKQKPGGLFSRRSYDAYQQTCYRVSKRWGSSSVTVNFRK